MSLILILPFSQHTPHLSEVQISHAVHHQFIQSQHLYRCLNTSALPYKEVFPKTDLTVMINDQDITVRTFACSLTSSHLTFTFYSIQSLVLAKLRPIDISQYINATILPYRQQLFVLLSLFLLLILADFHRMLPSQVKFVNSKDALENAFQVVLAAPLSPEAVVRTVQTRPLVDCKELCMSCLPLRNPFGAT